MMIILLVVAPLCSVALHAPIADDISDSASSLLETFGREGGADDDIDAVRYWKSRALVAEASRLYEVSPPRASSILQESGTDKKSARLPGSSWSEDRAVQRQLRDTRSFENSIAGGQGEFSSGGQIGAGAAGQFGAGAAGQLGAVESFGGAGAAPPLGGAGAPGAGALDPAIAGSAAVAIGAAGAPCPCGAPLDPLESLPLPPLPKPGPGPCGQLSPAAQAAQALGGLAAGAEAADGRTAESVSLGVQAPDPTQSTDPAVAAEALKIKAEIDPTPPPASDITLDPKMACDQKAKLIREAEIKHKYAVAIREIEKRRAPALALLATVADQENTMSATLQNTLREQVKGVNLVKQRLAAPKSPCGDGVGQDRVVKPLSEVIELLKGAQLPPKTNCAKAVAEAAARAATGAPKASAAPPTPGTMETTTQAPAPPAEPAAPE